ncbi:MAG: carboxylating nicotinate-nucleotide diphosphorylase [Bacillota bacterium]|uniref:Probable nicotinate-nucleotide pyrophosphorylase [carboxylating] n=1 Tax=Virgibacillus salarius TaxID=447199 RepID=A0A941IC93_9BACI|nr:MULTISPECIES: carboxylating nicotinate-nucleotide diphosphorylase [Bacillaceae]MBR7797162.1 carboxylating nicotinate-nucleotide diphosphorylase [Virgibacillus salarius]NAZ09871.1 carboxylating nicotinate-nucleotide diphosphorylase [Agaribacter marinus]MCC2251271.1 carboxylating nicotinate-nucleotide diphosphorylase [Virgibacillus sp. AGTR]MDY7043842.1 carboxylating nicotinate-nucleotide diphosphorylase [Virgibacillus sp. M23]QRZ19490.1 carboxylating nicotinate-nucleotide diphosphorylase [Vi
MNTMKLKSMLESFFLEDIGNGDISSQALFQPNKEGDLHLVAKRAGTFCGEAVIEIGFSIINPLINCNIHIKDGEFITAGTEIAHISGPIIELLQAERVVLNLIQRMSGVATMTANAVKLIEGTEAKICDTRKTTPGLRMLEKYAVQCGGGYNHRFGLYDAVMLKDNHIAFAGTITDAVQTVKKRLGHTTKIEVEIETEKQLMEAITNKVDIIMFDNCSPEIIKDWLQYVPEGIITEASGGIQIEQLHDYATSGIDYISLGYLTHSVKALDISATVKIRNV